VVAFANPVQGLIGAKGSVVPAGSFKVTATFADHLAGNRAPGIDIGNGGCGAPVLAMEAGIISFIKPGKVGSTSSVDASIVRISHANGWITGYAHLKIRSDLAVGQAVPEGYQLGTVDKIGAAACHLHWGPKDPSGVEVDGWPLLKQNGAVEDDDLDPSFSPKPNRTVTVNKGARHRLSPAIIPSNIAIASDPGGALGFPLLGTVIGEAVSGNAVWYAYWRPETSKVYYLHSSTCGAETPWEQTTGHSDAELIEAAKRAGYNAAADVAAMATATAAKYPKP
jgi:murein DD-endopeptidase MepM/ murein hydrolase activator NlpD